MDKVVSTWQATYSLILVKQNATVVTEVCKEIDNPTKTLNVFTQESFCRWDVIFVKSILKNLLYQEVGTSVYENHEFNPYEVDFQTGFCAKLFIQLWQILIFWLGCNVMLQLGRTILSYNLYNIFYLSFKCNFVIQL